MTEKEKMISGLPYIASDTELSEDRLTVRNLLHKFNLSNPDAFEERNTILKEMLGKTGENCYIEPPFRCDYGYNICVGEKFYANFNLVVLDCAPVTIGNNVMIGPNVGIYTATHPMHHELRISDVEFALPITIGDNVWLGGHVVINPGITIGHNVVIGSGSVVTKDIPDNVFAAGNPCKVIREITDEEKQYYHKDKVFVKQ